MKTVLASLLLLVSVQAYTTPMMATRAVKKAKKPAAKTVALKKVRLFVKMKEMECFLNKLYFTVIMIITNQTGNSSSQQGIPKLRYLWNQIQD